jgi:hypothetical protein
MPTAEEMAALMALKEDFGKWYARKQGVLTEGIVIVIDNLPHIVLKQYENSPGWHLVTPCTVDGKPLSTVGTVLSYYDEKTAELSDTIRNGKLNPMTHITDNLVDFLRDYPQHAPFVRKMLNDYK